MAIRPSPDETVKALRTAQIVGGAMLVSLGIFALAVAQVQRVKAPFGGFAPGVPYDLFRWIFVAFGLADLALVRVVRRAVLANHAIPPLSRLLNAAVAGLALCESVAIFGFVLFMIGGRAGDYYVFAVLSLVGFALYFPRRQGWEERARAISR